MIRSVYLALTILLLGCALAYPASSQGSLNTRNLHPRSDTELDMVHEPISFINFHMKKSEEIDRQLTVMSREAHKLSVEKNGQLFTRLDEANQAANGPNHPNVNRKQKQVDNAKTKLQNAKDAYTKHKQRMDELQREGENHKKMAHDAAQYDPVLQALLKP